MASSVGRFHVRALRVASAAVVWSAGAAGSPAKWGRSATVLPATGLSKPSISGWKGGRRHQATVVAMAVGAAPAGGTGDVETATIAAATAAAPKPSTRLAFVGKDEAQGQLLHSSTIMVVGNKDLLLSDKVLELLPAACKEIYTAMLEDTNADDAGVSATTWFLDGGVAKKLAVGVLPKSFSRHNSPALPHAITSTIGGKLGSGALLLVLADESHAFAAGGAVARAYPLYTRKTSKPAAPPAVDSDKGNGKEVFVGFSTAEGLFFEPDSAELKRIAAAADGIRLAGRLVDTAPAELTPDTLVQEAAAVAASLPGVRLEVVRGKELADKGFGGLWGVGKAAESPPALVILSFEPAGASRTVAWVGKGICFDTGGLNIKSREGMCGMKGDMGGAAAVLGAFQAAVTAGETRHKLYALLCIAENAVGPAATRCDDILTLYSGKTVEINNTDAEGRLVLGDGVAYASKHLNPDTIIDVATLTGAQLITTGRRVAAVLTNTEQLENAVVAAGKASGDLCHPIPFIPEFHRAEFKSPVADMKNSVKDRSNAQSACAGIFIYDHLSPDYAGGWVHLDIAGPSEGSDGRGTGFGVALLLELLKAV